MTSFQGQSDVPDVDSKASRSVGSTDRTVLWMSIGSLLILVTYVLASNLPDDAEKPSDDQKTNDPDAKPSWESKLRIKEDLGAHRTAKPCSVAV